MPELPEVETLKLQLQPKLVGKTIKSVFFHRDFGNTLRFRNKLDLESLLPGRRITEINRLGKYLVITLSDNNYLVFHLKIYGRLITNDSFSPPADHTHRFSLSLYDGTTLRFFDKSNIADIRLLSEDEVQEINTKLGPEPFSLSTDDFHQIVTSAKLPRIKDTILDQSMIAGVGNIYADEALFKAKISPWRKPAELSKQESLDLLKAIQEVLQSGIDHGGTSIESYYDTQGAPGQNQRYLVCYGQGGKPCPVCKNPIVQTEIAGRRTHYCATCQPESQLSLFG